MAESGEQTKTAGTGRRRTGNPGHRLPWIGLQLLKEAASRVIVGSLAVISSSNRATAPGASIAAVRDGEPSLAQSFRRTHDPLDPARPRRLDPLLAALGQSQPVRFGSAHLRGQPVRQLVLIADHRLAEAQHGPELRPVILSHPTRPRVPGEHGRIGLDLARYELHRRRPADPA
jgi:hypothetical protein